jgi:hypothetical protein
MGDRAAEGAMMFAVMSNRPFSGSGTIYCMLTSVFARFAELEISNGFEAAGGFENYNSN